VDAGRQAAIVDAGTRGVASCGDAGDAAACGVGTTIARISQPLLSACAGLEGATPAKLYLSADDSNSMASPVIARRLIRSGGDVPPSIVRPYEFLNYYDFSFEPAAPGEVRIVPQLSSCPSDGKLSLQIALQAEHRDPGARRPLSLTFVLDTSGSMQGQPVALERAAVRAVARRLRSGDVVSMVTWNTSQRELMAGHTVAGPDDPELLAAVAALGASGGTDLNGGLRRGYELAEQYYAPDRINRIVLISDGIANVGVTEEAIIGAHASDEEGQSGIYLAGVGVGAGVNDTLMNVVTDAGRGAYVYLDSEAEAERMLGEHLLEVVDVAARSVRLEVTLPWYLQVKKFYGEQISTNAAKVRPQHLGPDSAMLFFQILGSCDPSLIHGDDRILIRATWETPFERVSKASVIDTTLNALAGDDAALTKGAAVAGYAEALVLVGLRPRQEHAGILRRALGAVTAARGAGRDPDLVEIEELLRAYLVRHGG
jgi:Ca-activated chloride channel family protein